MEMIAMLDHQPLFAALDVSLEKTTVCVMSLDGAITKEAVVATDPEAIATCLSDDLGRLERVGVEAGPMSEWLARGLADLGVSVVLMETRQVRAALSAMIVKTDRKDARGMAHLLRTGWFRPVHVKTVDAREQRAMLSARTTLVARLKDIENSVRGLDHGQKHDPRPPGSTRHPRSLTPNDRRCPNGDGSWRDHIFFPCI